MRFADVHIHVLDAGMGPFDCVRSAWEEVNVFIS